jgi:hypothetical protein
MRYKKEEIQLYKRKMPSGLTVYYYRVYSPEGKRLRLSTGKSKKHGVPRQEKFPRLV